MIALQCLSLEPDGSATVSVRRRTLRFPSLEALAAWLHPETDPIAVDATGVTHRSLAMSAASQHFHQELAA